MNILNSTKANTVVASYIEDHNCAYALRILEVDKLQKMGSYGINLSLLSGLVTQLDSIHQNDVCPPTHIGTGPTETWADWVDTTRV